MSNFILFFIVLGTLASLIHADDGHDHVIIHVPYLIKTIKHTHTVTKHIHHKPEPKEEKIEVLGYTYGQPMSGQHHEMEGNMHGWGGSFGGVEMGDEHDSGHEGFSL